VYRVDPRIQLSGPVEDAVAGIGAGASCGRPLLAGSGNAVQDLEAWAAALRVVSTSIGAEAFRRGRRAPAAGDTAAAFADAVSRLLTCKNLRVSVWKSGRLLLEKEFTWVSAWEVWISDHSRSDNMLRLYWYG